MSYQGLNNFLKNFMSYSEVFFENEKFMKYNCNSDANLEGAEARIAS